MAEAMSLPHRLKRVRVKGRRRSRACHTSRRTPEALAALTAAISGVPQLVWDGTGDNPITPSLPMPTRSSPLTIRSTWSPTVKVLDDPVYVQRLKGSSTRLRRFHELMRERGATRRFAGKIESWPYTPPNDTELVASAIRRALGLETVG